MTVRAKMMCESVTDYGHGRKEVKFEAHYDPEIPEDMKLQIATPSASAKFLIDNPKASVQFEAGKYYYVDFEPVE